MKSYRLCGAMFLAAMSGRAADVTVWLETRALVNHSMVERAELVTVRIFAGTGLQVEWGTRTQCGTEAGAI